MSFKANQIKSYSGPKDYGKSYIKVSKSYILPWSAIFSAIVYWQIWVHQKATFKMFKEFWYEFNCTSKLPVRINGSMRIWRNPGITWHTFKTLAEFVPSCSTRITLSKACIGLLANNPIRCRDEYPLCYKYVIHKC